MISAPTDQPPPPGPGDSYQNEARYFERRIYFEQLAKILLSSGVKGDQVGRMVAELDEHVRLSRTSPVDELGPVGELAVALRKVGGRRHFASMIIGSLLSSLAFGLLIPTAASFGLGHNGYQPVDLKWVLMMTIYGVGGVLIWAYGGRSMTGRRTMELPSLPIVALYLAMAITVILVVPRQLNWHVPTVAAVALLVASASASGVAWRWTIRRIRVPVPGNARHLRNLGWGFLRR